VSELHFEVGERVQGTYLRQPFTGVVKDIDFSAAPLLRRYSIQFDQPVRVSPPPLQNLRRRVTVALGPDGESLDPKGRPDGIASVRRAPGADRGVVMAGAPV